MSRQRTDGETTPEITAELLARARNKDRAALSALYEATHLELYRTIHALIRDEDLTLDVQQDAYLRAFSHLEQLREPGSFLAWLRQIAVNEARGQLRRKKPMLFSELSEDEAEETELPDLRVEGSPELALDRSETARLLREILDGLPDGQRMLLGLYYYEQIPIAKICEELGLRPGTVKTQLNRGRKRVEAEIRRLEQQGVKLYGLSPLPFLLALLRRQTPAAEAKAAVLTKVLPEAVAVQVGRRFFETVAGRILLGLLTAAAVAGGVAGYSWVQNRVLSPMGDVRPTDAWTTEPAESPEELTLATTEAVVLPESPEELTAPATDAPTTEPATDAPTTAPTVPPEPSSEPAPPQPTQPTPQPVPQPPAPAPSTEAVETQTEEPTPPAQETEQAETQPQLPTVPPYPPKPAPATISLGETWTYRAQGEQTAELVFLARLIQTSEADRDSLWSAVVIGAQTGGVTELCFTPELAGTYQIYYVNQSAGGEISWTTIYVNGGDAQ